MGYDYNRTLVVCLVTDIKFVVDFDIPVHQLDEDSTEDLFGEGIKIIIHN